MKIKLVIFDADNTLIDFLKCERDALKSVFDHFRIELTNEAINLFSQIDNSLWRNGKWNNELVNSLDIPIKRFEILFKQLSLNNIDFELANKIFMNRFANTNYPLEDADEIVEYLYKKKITVCVATNGLVKLQYPRIINTNFGKYIKRIVVSEEVKKNKPSPEIFHEILKLENILSENAIVVGDSLPNDILGAKNAKIKSIWFNPNKLINKTEIVPTYEINSLLEIKTIV